MRIAIIGTGISGLTAAHELYSQHELTLFEANDYIGGHTHTVDVDVPSGRYAIDTGFIVFNDRTYPNFQCLLDTHQVAYRPTPMSFSVKNDRNGWEYCGSNLNGLFAQRRNLFNPRFLTMLRDIFRFNREAPKAIEETDQTVEEYLEQHGYSHSFSESYFLAMGAAIWSCPQEQFARFPIRFIARFFLNHGLLSITNRPQWFVIEGGSREYIPRLAEGFLDRIRLSTPIQRVRRFEDRVELQTASGELESYDHVVFACHSDQAKRMLADIDDFERHLLSCFPYEMNDVVLHTDESLLPKKRSTWSSWNYHVRADRPDSSTVTYNMNILQGIESPETFCITLNEDDLIDSRKILGRFKYAHPLFSLSRDAAQSHHTELIDRKRSSFCGAYWGNGFHEDGVNSALAVTKVLNQRGGSCEVPSTEGRVRHQRLTPVPTSFRLSVVVA